MAFLLKKKNSNTKSMSDDYELKKKKSSENQYTQCLYGGKAK